ncbi:MAG: DUF4352 domain-containing protein [Chloroflexi bacterium]|nr:DUF4352 domain-containing protein [Chloroflexota bacterium]
MLKGKSTLTSILLLAGVFLLCTTCARQQTTGELPGIGQAMDIDGWQITVHSLHLLPTDDWRQPAAGQVFCAVELTLENHSNQIRFFMPEKQMLLLDSEGRAYALNHNASVMAARARQWTAPSGEMSVGEVAYGAAAYQLPAGSQGVRWVFRSNLFPWSPSITFVLGDVPQ